MKNTANEMKTYELKVSYTNGPVVCLLVNGEPWTVEASDANEAYAHLHMDGTDADAKLQELSDLDAITAYWLEEAGTNKVATMSIA